MDDGAMGEKDSDRLTGNAAFRTAKEQFVRIYLSLNY